MPTRCGVEHPKDDRGYESRDYDDDTLTTDPARLRARTLRGRTGLSKTFLSMAFPRYALAVVRKQVEDDGRSVVAYHHSGFAESSAMSAASCVRGATALRRNQASEGMSVSA